MRNYYAILERAHSGPWLKEEEWDLDRVSRTVSQLVKKHGLSWQRAQLVNESPALADAVFRAGFELAAQLGAYCRSTERVIPLSEEELADGIAAMRSQITLGEGKDQSVLRARSVGDARLPTSWGGNPGAPTPEGLFLANAMSYVQEPLVDMLTCGTLTLVDGREVRTESPMEIIATRRELDYLHEALRRCGRPGMGMLAAQSSVSALGDLAVAHPRYLRPCDAHLIPMLNELKMDMRNMSRVVNSIEYGMLNASLACVIMGGLAGGPAGAAITQVASFLVANLTCLADYHLLHPIHVRHIATTTRETLWVTSIVAQAFARNAPCVVVADIYPKSGTGTLELLYETAANAIVATVSGAHLEGCGCVDGTLHHNTGLEARWMAEVGRATARQGLSLAQANELGLRLVPLYEHVFARPEGNPGLPFDQVYDLRSLCPTAQWSEMYHQAKAVVRDMGLSI